MPETVGARRWGRARPMSLPRGGGRRVRRVVRALHATPRRVVVLLAVVQGLVLVGAVGLLLVRGVGVYVVSSASMAPALPTGAVIVTSQAEVYGPGDAIAFETPSGVVTHRVVEVTADGRYLTQGDANDQRDPRPVLHDEVRGRVGTVIPGLGFLLVFLRQPASLPALALLVLEVQLGRKVLAATRSTPKERARCAELAG